MEQIIYYNAKNGQETCSINNINIHSSYNPDKEAERFVNLIEAKINPSIIFITEPGFSYCAKYLKQRFQHSKFIAIRYTNLFNKYDSEWDLCLYLSETTKEHELKSKFYELFTDEEICSSLFLSWQPSSKVFIENEKIFWKLIKEIVIKSRTVLFTRSYFSSRWILNQINFCKHLKEIYSIQKGTCNIAITASGPSLKTTLPYIKKNRENFFLIALSSSIVTLINSQIIPDLIITTDGGWWAKKHLECLKNYNIPIAIPSEANIQKEYFSTQKIIPLNYTDGIDSKILQSCNIQSIPAVRNGTVSGTALDLALSLTKGKIYFFGLDLSSSKGFQHSQPNMLELHNSPFDYKISPKEYRIFKTELNCESLKIYEEWFKIKSEKIYDRVFRVSNNYPYSNKLGKILDININDVELNSKIDINVFKTNTTVTNVIEKIKTYIKSNYFTDEWKKELFPTEYIAYKKAISEDEQKEKELQLNNKNEKLISKIWKILNE